MRDTLYKALGFLVWKGFVADVRRRSRTAAVRGGALALAATILAGVVVLAQRRAGDGG